MPVWGVWELFLNRAEASRAAHADLMRKQNLFALSKCPNCGYHAFNGEECFDCGYRPGKE
jgi:ribosomal protein L32